MHPRSLLLAAILWAAAGLAAAAPAPCTGTDAGQYVMLAENALARGLWPRAGDAYACAAEASGDARVAEQATRVSFEHGQLRDAERSARRWLALEPAREEALRFLATSLLREYQGAEAARQFAAILSNAYADRAKGYLALLGTLSEESNAYGAATVMDTLAAADPAVAEAQYARSVLWQQAANGARALAGAREALRLKPGWRLAELAEVRALLSLGRADEALKRAAAVAADGDPLSRLNEAWLLAAARREGPAREIFEDLRRNDVAVPQALEGLGALAFDRHDYDEAARDFTQLAQMSQGDATAVAYLGMIAEKQGKPALAARLLERVDTGPRAVASQLAAYRLMVKLGLPERAQLVLSDYLERSPEDTRDVAVGRANQLADAGQPDAGIALLRRVSSLYPDDDDLRLARAYLLEKLDRVPEAVQLMREVLARRPDDPTTLNSLGYTLVDRTGEVAEGYRLVARALEASPDSYAIMDSAGWGLYRLERYAEARELLERAWQHSRDPEVAAHLGEVLWAQGHQDQARALWKEAGDIDPDNRTLRRILERHRG